jgi:uncharacterized membrane protein
MAFLNSLSCRPGLLTRQGTLHFDKHDGYLKIMPPGIPWYVPMVRVTDGLDILGF